MAAIVTGTVVLWKIGGPVGNERVEYEDDEAVKAFVPSDETGDDVADAQVVALLSAFLLTKLGEEEEGEKEPLKEIRRLLEKGPRGLLQVVGIDRNSVKRPPPSTEKQSAKRTPRSKVTLGAEQHEAN